MTIVSQKNARTKITDLYLKEHLRNENKIESTHPWFSDLQYLHYLKSDVSKYIINPLTKYENYNSFGIKPGKVLLLNGVKSIGKRFFVKSICSEYKFNFLDVFIENEKDLKNCFRKSFDMEPCLIYIDNVQSDEKERLIYEIARGIEKMENNRVILILGCRNKSSLSENTLKVVNHTIEMRVPTEDDRKCIFESFKLKNLTNIDFTELAKLTPGYLPKDLYDLCVSAISESICQNKRNLEQSDFLLHIKSERKLNLDDIGALEAVKEELKMNIILPLEHPEKFKKMGIDRTSGILLFGPPGCGKTMLAKAISNMLYCNFMSVSGPELINKYVGDTEKELREIFNRARQQEPCVLFFDEIDSLCSKRGNNDFQTRVVNQMLTLMDGVDEKGKVFIIGATNRIHALDKAIIRPGRFDKILEVPLPSYTERIQIFQKCIEKIPTEPFSHEELDLDGFSGADIAGFVREASMIALKENFMSDETVIKLPHFLKAIDTMKNRLSNAKDY